MAKKTPLVFEGFSFNENSKSNCETVFSTVRTSIAINNFCFFLLYCYTGCPQVTSEELDYEFLFLQSALINLKWLGFVSL